ncbi:MAG: hypothetical protein WBQ04_05600, partial [Candidatus Acidiferrales bacterium]
MKYEIVEMGTTAQKLYVKDGRQVIAVKKRYLINGEKQTITILRGFYANDNYDLCDFGLDSNTSVSAGVASTT